MHEDKYIICIISQNKLHACIYMQTNTDLRVLIFPYIPDLNEDNLESLRNYIKTEFEARHKDITLEVHGTSSSHNLYDLDTMRKYLGTGPDAYDVVEADAILLGEIINLLQPNPAPAIKVETSSFLPLAVDAVTYGGKIYGIPTLVCANFIAKMKSPSGSETLDLIGNFRGSWTLPGHYLSAYVNTYGESLLYQGVNSNPEDHPDVVNSIKQLSDRCLRSDGRSNPCTDRSYSNNSTRMTEDVIKSKESQFLAYSEVIGEVLHRSPAVVVESVAIPPLGQRENNLVMFTDAVVANRNSYPTKEDAIKRFMEFYTSDDFRFSYAFCGDMVEVGDTSCTRYVLPANNNFYQNSRVTNNSLYQRLYTIIKPNGISGPNNQLYGRRGFLNNSLSAMLGYNDVTRDEL